MTGYHYHRRNMSVPRSATITLAEALLIGTPVALALVTFLAIT
jgi:hypothetical protein